jgi:hypothetical protein
MCMVQLYILHRLYICTATLDYSTVVPGAIVPGSLGYLLLTPVTWYIPVVVLVHET